MSDSDSDNKYTLRRRRDKFSGERSEATEYYRPERRHSRSNYSRSIPRDQRSQGRDRSYSPNSEQSVKRFKYNNYQKSVVHNYRYQNYQQPRQDVRPRQTLMMPFKHFILTQDDKISEGDAIANYNKYKLEFQAQQIENFFTAHKNEEWFRSKYHPEDSRKYQEEQVSTAKRRADVFLELLNANKIDCVNVDSDNRNNLLKILDTIVLKLEGGTEEDIAVLEKEYSKLENKTETEQLVESNGGNKEGSTEKIQIEESSVQSEISQEVEENNNECKMEKHKTTSICLRHLPSTITRKEIESICSKYNGFLRVSLSDPEPENNWIRRGWVTFKRDSDIKEICCNLNKLRLKDSELDAKVNEDLSCRIALVNGISADKEVVKSDIRISVKIVLHLDKQAGLWLGNDEETVGALSSNPILRNVSNYLVEEEWIGPKPNSENTNETVVDRDDALIAILDKIILYLRIVHSVDYYNNCSKHLREDEMPNRCGILHVRGPPPSKKPEMSEFLGKEAEARKLVHFFAEKGDESESENENKIKLINLAVKDFDKEVEKFVLKNSLELGEGKWQCPLSGKKFKGPEFVRKHIFLKYCDKIEEVKKDVEYFNNYVRDPKRLVLETMQPKEDSNVSTRYNHHQEFARFYRPHSAPQVMAGKFGSRGVGNYIDLDAPAEEIEELY